MSDFSFLPGVLEIVLVLMATVILLPRILSITCVNPAMPLLFVAGLAFCLVSILIGGEPVAAMTAKVLAFSTIIFFALRQTKVARWWLLLSVLIELSVQAAAGNVLNKYSPIPFLLLACLWAVYFARENIRETMVVFAALVAECAQAIMLDSRGLLLLAVIAFGILCGPLSMLRRAVISLAILLPIVYPVTLFFVFGDLVSGGNLWEATGSNFERSAMAAWCVTNLPSFPFVGPGVIVFSDDINALKAIIGHVDSDAFDPHHFLLSAWLYLGTFVLVALYIGWCRIWLSACGTSYCTDSRIRFYAILAAMAILTFVLSPPDSSRRVQVGLLTGIAITGLRRPVLCKNEMNGVGALNKNKYSAQII